MMEHLVLAARDAGITEFVFVVGYGEREIRGHFGDGSVFGIRIRYASQRQQRGTADALRSALDLVTGPFILLNGDMIIKKTDIEELCKCHAPCMSISTTDHPWDYGAVMVENNVVTGLEEKSKTRGQPSSMPELIFSHRIFSVRLTEFRLQAGESLSSLMHFSDILRRRN
jgi:bifunctional UDP-N-acetylglucosamine pyrophosphorylase/glucosamine-1-phosphate N-acetyltransferase